MKNYIDLANGISWKNKSLVNDVLSKNVDLDLLFDKGTFFNMSIENNSCDIVNSLLNYFNSNQLAKYTTGSTEYLLLKNKLRDILEVAIEDVELSQGMKEMLSSYLDFEGSEHDDSFSDNNEQTHDDLADQKQFAPLKKSYSVNSLHNSTFDNSQENLLTEENLKRLSTQSSEEKLKLIESFIGTHNVQIIHSDTEHPVTNLTGDSKLPIDEEV